MNAVTDAAPRRPNRLRRVLRGLGCFVLAIVLLVLGALALAWWSTTPPAGLSPDAPPPPVVLRAGDGPLRVGAAVVSIAPTTSGLFLGGFGQNRRATGLHDPIEARAFALERGDVRVVLVALDLIGVHHHHQAIVRGRLAARVRPEAVLVLATHDHSAPDTLGLWGPNPVTSGVDPGFLEQALSGAVRAAELALDGLRPARLTLARADAPEKGISKNPRDPAVIDREVLVLAADELTSGAPIGTLVVFACHPEVLFGKNREITADFPGVLRREVDARRGGVTVYVNGPLGGMVTPDVTAHTFEECERVGRALAGVVLAALGAESPAPVRFDHAPLTWVEERIVVPIQNRRFLLARRLGVFDRPFVGAGYLESACHALRLGPLELATVPGEALPRVGFEVKAGLETPFRAVLGLAGDELGYLIPEAAFEDPERYRYEKTVSPGPLATQVIREGALEAGRRARTP